MHDNYFGMQFMQDFHAISHLINLVCSLYKASEDKRKKVLLFPYYDPRIALTVQYVIFNLEINTRKIVE